MSAVSVTHFPAGPTARMLSLLPAARRMRGVRPWRPHLFVRALLGGGLSSDGEVAARCLLYLLIETQYELRPAWECVVAEAGGWLCLLRRPSEEEFRRVWKTAPVPPYSFQLEVGTLSQGRLSCGTKRIRFWESCARARHLDAEAEDEEAAGEYP